MAEFEAKIPASEQVFREKLSAALPAMEASPHLRRGAGTRAIMGNVLLALLPAIFGSLFFFGPAVLPYYAVSVLAAMACDFIVQTIKKRKWREAFDLSPVVTGALLAMSVPVGVPVWYTALGSALGILVAKELFGGIGFNFLNPALFGRAVLRIAFPAQMTLSAPISPPFGMAATVDTVAGATPLTVLKDGGQLTNTELWNAFIGLTAGKIGETSALLLLLGASWLFYRGIIRPRIPAAFLAAVAVMAFVFGGPSGLFSGDLGTVLGHLLGGATMLGAFFMVTDYSSSPSSPLAQVVFGALCGVGTMAFRLFSPLPEGFTFAVLIACCTVPLLNRFIRPRVLGETRGS